MENLEEAKTLADLKSLIDSKRAEIVAEFDQETWDKLMAGTLTKDARAAVMSFIGHA